MYDYEFKRVKAQELEKTLETIPGDDWELVTIVPASATPGGPLSADYFLIVVRRPKP
jgi:hypothetical protein